MRDTPLWFRALLRALPRALRERHGADIAELAGAYARGRAWPVRAAVWLRAAGDLIAVAVSARLAGAPTRRGAIGRVSDMTSEGFTVDGLVRDARLGVRALRRDAGLAVFAVLVVGLGVGACVTVFSVVQALLLRPLPFERPDELVWISNGEWGRGQALSELSVQVGYVVDMREHATQLQDVAGYHLFDGQGDHTLAGEAGPQRVSRLRVTDNLFAVLGVEPEHGRLFSAEEAWDDGPPAILLTHGFWTRRFAGDPSVVGTRVVLDDRPTTIVGVLPAAFDFTAIFAPGDRVDYVAPFPLSERSNRNGNTLGLIGRLAPGATVVSVRDEARVIAARPTDQRRNGFEPVALPLRDHVSGSFRTTMRVLVAAVALVMLIVCANLSNLLLARGASREQEMAVRAALGARRRRLVQQLLIESVVLSLAGAALGIVLAYLGTAFLAGRDLPIALLSETRVDGAALALALTAAVAVGLVFGIAPALRSTGGDLQDSLREGSKGSAGRDKNRLRNTLVVSEVTLACILLVVSTLVTRSLVELLETDLGFRPERAVAIRVDPSVRVGSSEERAEFFTQVLGRAQAIPGVDEAGLSDILPMGFNRTWNARALDAADDQDVVFPFMRIVTDGYVAAMGMTLLRGRDFAPSDAWSTPMVALTSEALAEALWPGLDPIGRRLTTSGREAEVVGVVRGTRQLSADQAPLPELFLSLRQMGDHDAAYLILRSDRPLETLIASVRSELRALDPGLPLDVVETLQEVVETSVAPRRFLVTLLLAFAAFALLLASLGIYGVISYSVAQRTREIGIRIALGASVRLVRRRIVGETVALTTVGLAIGLLASLGVGRAIESLLFGVTALDPVTYLGVGAMLATVAVAAGWLPARRIVEATPLEVLSDNAPR